MLRRCPRLLPTTAGMELYLKEERTTFRWLESRSFPQPLTEADSGYTVKHRNFEIEIPLPNCLPSSDPIAEKAMGSDLRSLTCPEQTVMCSRPANSGLTDSLPAAIRSEEHTSELQSLRHL